MCVNEEEKYKKTPVRQYTTLIAQQKQPNSNAFTLHMNEFNIKC